MSLADRIAAAVSALKGKQSTDQQTIASLKDQLQASQAAEASAVSAMQQAQATAAQASADAAAAKQALSDLQAQVGDVTELSTATTTLEQMAA